MEKTNLKENIRQICSEYRGVKALEELQKEKTYLFHGSIITGLERLEPRQATNFERPDGNPAIFATDIIECAIFKPLVSIAQKNVKGSTKSGWEEGAKPIFYMSSNVNAYLISNPKAKASVYILDKSDFKSEKRGLVSTKPIEVLGEVIVGTGDLPAYEIREYQSIPN
jgi:hypothetical protein